jgi:hypothetical protein
LSLGKFPTNTIDECAQELIASGLVQAVDFTTGAIALASVIESIFAAPQSI